MKAMPPLFCRFCDIPYRVTNLPFIPEESNNELPMLKNRVRFSERGHPRCPIPGAQRSKVGIEGQNTYMCLGFD